MTNSSPHRTPTTRITCLAGAIALSSALAACGSDSSATSSVDEDCVPAHEFSTISDGTLTIGVSDMPPQSSTTGDNGYSGLDADIIDGFAAAECLTVTPMTGTSNTMVTGVEQGRWDTALGGWYRTNERAEVVNMGAPLYLDSFAIIGDDEYPTLDDLDGLTVGTVDGYNYVEDLRAIFGDDLKLYPSALELAQDLDAGRIDVIIDAVIAAPVTYGEDYTVTVPEPDERVPASLEPAQCSLPFNKDNEELLAAFDAYIEQIRADGTLGDLLEEYGLDASLAETGESRFL